MVTRRCGNYSPDNTHGCCRPVEEHPTLCCAHPADELTGTPGLLTGRRRCDGLTRPVATTLDASHAPGDHRSRFVLVIPGEGADAP